MLFRASVLAAAIIYLGSLHPLRAGYSPTITEINIGSVPIDLYSSGSTNGALGTPLPSCPSSYTIRNCYKLFFNNNSATSPYTSTNYVAQGVTGVRFQFALWGGDGNPATASTPFDPYGNVQSAWVTNLTTFLSDLYSYGIVRVTPNPALDGWTGTPDVPNSPAIVGCDGSTPMGFFPWLPYGELSSGGSYFIPDCQDNNDGYSTANANTDNFWGWSPFFNLVYDIFGAINSSGLTLKEFDIQNEIKLLDFTVWGRLFYDNKHPSGGGTTDVLGTLRSYASTFGLDPYSITASTAAYRPTSSSFDCGSVYGDSAILLGESELIGTLAGGYSAFGIPSSSSISSGLVCSGYDTYMVSLPVSYTTPDVSDVHLYPCVATAFDGGCDASQSDADVVAVATTSYNDFWWFLYYRSLTGNTAMVGETTSNQACDGYLAAWAGDNVSGYEASYLYANHASETTLRVWDNAPDSCYTTPSTINPPYTP